MRAGKTLGVPLALLLGAAISLPSAQAQPPIQAPQPSRASTQEQPRRLSPTDRIAALTAIKSALAERYVFPELRPKLVERLQQGEKAGRYAVDDPFLFAERITEDLRDAGHDRHLWMRVDTPAYLAALAPPHGEDGEEALERSRARRDHHGLAEMKILPGNVRYLKITGFEWVPDETGTAYDDAMRFLKEGNAIVIDLRGNGGGSHGAVRYLVSHFLDGDVLEMTFLRSGEAPKQSWSLEHLPAGRLKGKPLYVLIDGEVGSAAEAFAYDVRQFKLGTLVGATTAGAANNNALLPVAPTFILSVSEGRPEHPVSHANWEGVGVAPDVESRPAQALDVAQSLALQRLAESPGQPPEVSAGISWARSEVEARLQPVTLSSDRIAALAGHYGDIEIELDGGALRLNRPSRSRWPAHARLTPLTADGLFAVEGFESLHVRLTGTALELLWADEAGPLSIPRDSTNR